MLFPARGLPLKLLQTTRRKKLRAALAGEREVALDPHEK
jgi:hypothetical protein